MKFDAFTSRKNGLDGYAWIRMGAMMKALFNNLKAFTKFSSHLNVSLLAWVMLKGVNLWVIFDKIQ
jgi:hypothetical protein